MYSLWLRRAGYRREHAQVRRIARSDQSWVRRFTSRSPRSPRPVRERARLTHDVDLAISRLAGGVTKGDMLQSMTPLLFSARSSSQGPDLVDPEAGKCEIPTLSVPAAGACQVSLHIPARILTGFSRR